MSVRRRACSVLGPYCSRRPAASLLPNPVRAVSSSARRSATDVAQKVSDAIVSPTGFGVFPAAAPAVGCDQKSSTRLGGSLCALWAGNEAWGWARGGGSDPRGVVDPVHYNRLK